MKTKENILATAIIILASIILLAWPCISWVDVIAHNTDPESAKELATHGWNFFIVFFG